MRHIIITMTTSLICIIFFWLSCCLAHIEYSENDVLHDDYDTTTTHDQNRKNDDDNRPNIILLLTDDQDVMIGGIDNMPYLRMHLLEQGMMFANAFVHTPVCCPSRSSILSGRYLHNGIFINNSLSGNCNGEGWQADAEQTTFAVHAKNSGYRTSYAGKYLNQYGVPGSPGCSYDKYPNETGCSRVPPGWEKWFGLEGNSVYYNYSIVQSDDDGKHSFRVKHNDIYEHDYLPDLVTNRTINMIRQFTSVDETKSNTKRQPFLIVNAWPSPHAPFTAAPWAEHLYDGVKAHRTGNWNASYEYMKQKHWIMRRLAPIDNPTEEWIDNAYKLRLQTLRSVDSHINDIINVLEEKGIRNNTIIIYTSDNGFQLGQHRLQTDKRHLYEHDIRVPFIVVGPGIAANLTTNDIVLNIDIAPTIYEIVTGGIDRLTPPQNMDGISFASLLRTSSVDVHNNEDKNIHPRYDFLISYNGEGFPECGLADCPPTPPSEYHGGPMPDSFNNTYNCVRTLMIPSDNEDSTNVVSDHSLNTIYCRFQDDENFVEYYDLNVDEWQLSNTYNKLDLPTRAYYEARLAQLLKCKGESCRSTTEAVQDVM